MRNPESVAALAAVEAADPIDFGGQRRLDVVVEGLPHLFRSERPIDRDEEIAHGGVIGFGKGPD